ncbi:hypothetical protein BST81_21405 [Leptolyngbya sp. 'hensonii']|uniref:ExeM/NucH family extracellular endonuclease n=1 Tax=Leptolyngbya sp. 'hensonii' TaxID=1922337 RepID=UPI00094FD3D6|nr:ExeM/NucH family extracellular endonuclease [Leptolyngbya sp. 'hensonii']OLP16352.1 hypothetical protein BST81_21405 [Leptolyngbya sp. 'hensonii']
MATTLNPGDIAIVGFRSGTPDGLAFVTFKDLDAGTMLGFTDASYQQSNTAGSWRGTENFAVWTASTPIPAGTVVVLSFPASPTSDNGTITGALSGLSGSGDQIFVYQRADGTVSTSSPFTAAATSTTWNAANGGSLLFGINFASTGGFITSGTGNLNSTNTSYVPDAGSGAGALTLGSTALSITNSGIIANAQYNGPRSGLSIEDFKTQILNQSNWTGVDSTSGTLDSGDFAIASSLPSVTLSVSPTTGTEANQTVITVTATASSAVSGDQTVNLEVSGAGLTSEDYSLSSTVITIPDGQTTGSVTFTIQDDTAIEGAETAALTISNPSTGVVLGSTTTQDISITDNDIAPAGVTIAPSDGSTNVTEGGATDAYTVVLNSQPTADVTITLNAGTQLTPSTSTLTFTPDNWNVGQEVTVTAVDDAVFEGLHAGTIAHTVTSADTSYNGLAIPGVTASITDNESETNPSLQIRITEYMYSGANGEFVEFTNIGTSAVDLTGWSFDDNSRVPGSFSLSGFGVVQPGESVILTENTDAAFRTAWNLSPSTKVIGGLNQNLGRADEINLYNNNNQRVDRLTYDDQTIAGSVRTQNVSGWTSLANLGGNNAAQWQLSTVGDTQGSLTSTGGDIGNPGGYVTGVVPAVILSQTGNSTTVTEGGGTDSYTIALTTTPTAPVNITVSAGAQALVSTDGVNFFSSLDLSFDNTAAQTITVQAVDDATFETKPHAGTIAHSISSADAVYAGLTIPSLAISITDNDTAPNSPAIRITEYQYDGNGSEFFELTNTGATAVDLSGWSYDDDSRLAGTFSLSPFGLVAPGESVIVTENTAEGFRNDWGLSASVKVIGGLTVNLGREDEINIFDNNGQLIDSLTYGDSTKFPGTGRTQNVSAWTTAANLGKNDVTQWQLSTVGDALNSFNSLSGGTGNPGSFSASATPTPAVIINQSGGNTNVTEGGATDTYTVVLRSQPTADVTIALTPNAQLTPSAPTLTFTPDNWNVAQTVTVTAVDDALFEGSHSGAITHSASSTDASYNGISVPTVSATITDNDTAVGAVPTIQESTATPFLNLAATGSGTVSGVIGDSTDPASSLGIDFTIADTDTPLDNLTVTVSSSNPSVVPNGNLTLTGSGGTRNLKIDPTGVGLANIVVSVSDGNNVVNYTINYAASAASGTPATTRFHTGTSDASTAIALDAQYMLVGDDEDQTIRLYDRNNSGLPLASFDFTSALGLTGSSEIDLEASTRIDNTIYWMGSHANNSSAQDAPNRERIFATQLTGTGASATLTAQGYYQFLEDDLIAWDNSNGHGLGAGFLGLSASAADGVGPEFPNGFNIEGLTIAPDGQTAYVSFRAPQEPTAARSDALIVPVTNFTSLFNASGGTAGSTQFGAPIFLDLDGRGIRSIERNATGEYVIIAGPAGAATGTAPNDFRLYTWTGNGADAPVLRNADLTALNANGSFESIVAVPDNLTSGSQIQLLVDNGDTIWYNNGTASKDLSQDNFQKFRSETVTLGSPFNPFPLPAGAISLASPYSQDFNTLISSGSATWVNNTIEGWYTARTGTGTTIVANDGGSNAGNLYSYGSTGSTERSLGSVGSGNAAAGNFFWGGRFFNDTGSTVNTLYINYFGEQWRNSAATGQTLDFQYQIGATGLTTGTWTNFDPLDFTSPITGGTASALNGNLAQNRTLVSGTLNNLSLAPGQEIWFRWSDPDHPGSDHGLSIDDVKVSTSPLAGITLTESGGNTTVNEAGETTDTYTIALNTAPAAPVTIAIAAPDNQTQISSDGVNFFSSLNLALNSTTPQTITVRAVNDLAVEGSPHAGLITHTVTSADTSYNGLAVPTVNASILDNDVALTITKIHEIQGSGSTANFLSQTKTIEGVVVSAFLGSSGLNGFYVQEENADWDGDAATSEGIFIFDPTGLFSGAVGDKVQVTGLVAEFTSSATGITGSTINSSLTQLSLASSVATKSVVNLGASALPDVTNVTLPVADASILERYEGMLVNISAATGSLTVTNNFTLGRFGQVGLSAGDRLDQYTQVNAPSVSGYADYVANLLDNYIILDDGSNTQNPASVIHARNGEPLSATNTLRGGDTIASISGVLDQRFEGYRVQTTTPANFQATNPREDSAPDVGGSLKVASFNLLNFFNGNGSNQEESAGGFPTPRGAESLTEYNRQIAKTVEAVLGLNPDVFGYNEMENDGYGPTSAVQTLVDALNAATAPGTYAFIIPPADALNASGGFGGDEITVGFIYKTSAVRVAEGTSVAALTTGAFAQDDGNRVQRPALAVTFEQLNNGTPTNATFTAVINHFKSKGSSAGGIGDADAGDGQGLSNGTRTRAAEDLAAWLATNPTGTADADYLIMGDLNSYRFEDPITTLTNAGYTSLFGPESYSYQFQGQWGSLDHALATGSLTSQVTGAAKWHINADEPVSLDYNTNFKSTIQQTSFYNVDPFASSDHDPLVVGLNLQPTNRPPIAVSDTVNPDEETAVTVNVLSNDSDPDNDTLTLTQVNGSAVTVGNPLTLASGALLTLNADNTFSYNPNGQFETLSVGQSAADSFTYTIADENGATATATVDVTIAGVNDAPIANNDSATTTDLQPVTLNVLANDTDVDSGVLSVIGFTNPTQGSVTQNGNDLIYTPIVGASGSDSFTYTISDGNGGTATATVDLSVTLADNQILGTNGVDYLFGTNRKDTIQALAGNDILFGGIGDDTLLGGAGNDALGGGSGNDLLDGGTGADLMDGGDGNDTYQVDNLNDEVNEGFNAGTDLVFSSVSFTLDNNIENLTLIGASPINGTGNNLANILIGNEAINILIGNNGNDTLDGAGGNDGLSGGNGSDSLLGGNGNDILLGGAGADSLTGGADNDTFLYTALNQSLLSGFDAITDLQIGSDVIDGVRAVSAANLAELGAVTDLTASAIGAVLTTGSFRANGAATFTLGAGSGTRTFLALNNGAAGFSAATDSIIEITGYSGNLNNLAIV